MHIKRQRTMRHGRVIDLKVQGPASTDVCLWDQVLSAGWNAPLLSVAPSVASIIGRMRCRLLLPNLRRHVLFGRVNFRQDVNILPCASRLEHLSELWNFYILPIMPHKDTKIEPISPPPISMIAQRRSSLLDPPDTPSAVISLWNDSKDLFNRRTIRIDSDSVGYGFVLRGDGPTYVQTVDPTGPAATSGLRIGHIIQTVNGIDVMSLNHKDTAKVILSRRLASVTLHVLEPAS